MNKVEFYVDFGKGSIGSRFKYDCSTDSEIKADLLMASSLIIRVMSLAKNTEAKSDFAKIIFEGMSSIVPALSNFIDEYKNLYNINELELVDNAIGNTKRGFKYELEFSDEYLGTNLTPRGFGFFGKNIEFHSYMMVLLLLSSLPAKYRRNSKINKVIDNVLTTSIVSIPESGAVPPREFNGLVYFIVNESL